MIGLSGTKECVHEIYGRASAMVRYKNKRDLPWRETKDPYAVWVSEIMLQQTRVDTAIAYYLRFMERFRDVRALADASEEEVLNLWKGLGYYSRARNMHKAAKIVAGEYGGVFPREPDRIARLPGVGRYTAGGRWPASPAVCRRPRWMGTCCAS